MPFSGVEERLGISRHDAITPLSYASTPLRHFLTPLRHYATFLRHYATFLRHYSQTRNKRRVSNYRRTFLPERVIIDAPSVGPIAAKCM